MKGILVVLDGLGDLPHTLLQGKTPLEAARKPALNLLSGNANLWYMYSVSEKFVPESDKGMLHILGKEKTLISRGQLESIGAGIELKSGDLALRANFGTVDPSNRKKIVDRRVGRTLTTKEAMLLAKSINKQVKLEHPFIFQPTVQHRGVLVMKGSFSENISNTDPAYPKDGKFVGDDVKDAASLDESELSEYTAGQVNSFMMQSMEVLEKHFINNKRARKGELPANIILMRGAGAQLPKIQKFNKWAAFVYMPLEIGIAKTFGMKVFSFKYTLKSYSVYKSLRKLLKKAAKTAVKMIKKQQKNFDYFYVHFKETDLPGHDNKPLEKKAMIELLDKYFFSYLVKLAKKQEVKILVTGDHATPCKLSSHSADPVPVLYFDGKFTSSQSVNFCEKTCLERKQKVYGKYLLRKAGFV